MITPKGSAGWHLCDFIRHNREYTGLFLDSKTRDIFIGKMLKTSMILNRPITESNGMTASQAETILRFMLTGCVFTIVRNMQVSDEEWEKIKDMIHQGFRSYIPEVRE